MNKTLLFAIVGALALTATVYIASHKNSNFRGETDDAATLFKQFKKTYNKRYADPAFETYRFKVFSQNLETIKTDSTFGMTQFMDLTPSEFAASYLTLFKKQSNSRPTFISKGNAKEVDWTDNKKVTPIKDQGQCGSCWAFSAVGSVESSIIISGKAKVDKLNLAEQELVDCALLPKYNSNGCEGGWMVEGFKYIIDNKLSQTSDYAYTATDGDCRGPEIKSQKYTIDSYAEIKEGDCDGLQSALANQPISVAVDATQFQFYSGGILSKCDANLNHGVLLVGNKGGAFKIKNSWGGSWGEKGFIRLALGNTCGVCNAASYPIVKSSDV